MNNNCDGKKYGFWEAVQCASTDAAAVSVTIITMYIYPGALIFMLNSLLSHDDRLSLCAARIL